MHHTRPGNLALCVALGFLATQSLAAADVPSRPRLSEGRAFLDAMPERAAIQNVFHDFAAAARWLVANKVTSAKRLAIAGGSNGGLLVGAPLNQHPELFGATLPAVGVMGILRFQKFTIGWAWTSKLIEEAAGQLAFLAKTIGSSAR